jgi:iturin family lipopeptide synthetase A
MTSVIALREIEEKLAENEDVVQVAAVDQHGESGEATGIVGYVVLRRSNEGAEAGLKAFLLREGLPNNMIPSKIFALDQMPVDSSGKIDRLALSKLSYINKTTPTSDG